MDLSENRSQQNTIKISNSLKKLNNKLQRIESISYTELVEVLDKNKFKFNNINNNSNLNNFLNNLVKNNNILESNSNNIVQCNLSKHINNIQNDIGDIFNKENKNISENNKTNIYININGIFISLINKFDYVSDYFQAIDTNGNEYCLSAYKYNSQIQENIDQIEKYIKILTSLKNKENIIEFIGSCKISEAKQIEDNNNSNKDSFNNYKNNADNNINYLDEIFSCNIEDNKNTSILEDDIKNNNKINLNCKSKSNRNLNKIEMFQKDELNNYFNIENDNILKNNSHVYNINVKNNLESNYLNKIKKIELEKNMKNYSYVFLLFEPITGISVYDLIAQLNAKYTKDGQSININYLLNLTKHINTGLRNLHDIGYSYSNLKLKNILITKDKKYKLTNFLYSVKDNSNQIQYVKNSIYNNSLKAPEIILYNSNNISINSIITKNSDIFTFGMLIYSMVFNDSIFNSSDINSNYACESFFAKNNYKFIEKYYFIIEKINIVYKNTNEFMVKSLMKLIIEMLNENTNQRINTIDIEERIDFIFNTSRKDITYYSNKSLKTNNLEIKENKDDNTKYKKIDFECNNSNKKLSNKNSKKSVSFVIDNNIIKFNNRSYIKDSNENNLNHNENYTIVNNKKCIEEPRAYIDKNKTLIDNTFKSINSISSNSDEELEFTNKNSIDKLESKAKGFTIMEKIIDLTTKIFKRHSTLFWIIKLTDETNNLCVNTTVRYLKLLVTKAYQKPEKVLKFIEGLSKRPIYYNSIVALKSCYILYFYFLLGNKSLFNYDNLLDFLSVFVNVWKIRFKKSIYEKDDYFSNSYITKLIIDILELLITKIKYFNNFNINKDIIDKSNIIKDKSNKTCNLFDRLSHNYSIHELLITTNSNLNSNIFVKTIDSILTKDHLKATLKLYKHLITFFSLIPLHVYEINSNLDIIMHIINEEICCLFNYLFMIFTGFKLLISFKSNKFENNTNLKHIDNNIEDPKNKQQSNLINNEYLTNIDYDFYLNKFVIYTNNAIKSFTTNLTNFRKSNKSLLIMYNIPKNFYNVFIDLDNKFLGNNIYQYFIYCSNLNTFSTPIKVHFNTECLINNGTFKDYCFDNPLNSFGVSDICINSFFNQNKYEFKKEFQSDIDIKQNKNSNIIINNYKSINNNNFNNYSSPQKKKRDYNKNNISKNLKFELEEIFNSSNSAKLNKETSSIINTAINRIYDNNNTCNNENNIENKEENKSIQIYNFTNNINISPEENITKLANNILQQSILEHQQHWIIKSKELDLEKQIGFGGSSEVYLGYYRGCEVAVKKLKVLEMKEESLKEFKREISTLILLKHPNLILFMGAVIEHDNISIVTEFCSGGTLFSLLHQKKNIELSWEFRIKILLDIAIGMNFLHTNSPFVIHRDLKSLK